MASELPKNSTASTAFYELEELEVIELDEDTIRELLEDTEEEAQDNYESMEVQTNHNIKMENSDSIEKIEAPGENYNWLDTMETTPDMACNDLAFWYTDACNEEMVIETTDMRETIDSSQMYNYAFQMDEIAYTGLWQNN